MQGCQGMSSLLGNKKAGGKIVFFGEVLNQGDRMPSSTCFAPHHVTVHNIILKDEKHSGHFQCIFITLNLYVYLIHNTVSCFKSLSQLELSPLPSFTYFIKRHFNLMTVLNLDTTWLLPTILRDSFPKLPCIWNKHVCIVLQVMRKSVLCLQGCINNAELSCHSILQNMDWKVGNSFLGEDITAGFMERTEMCRKEEAGWEIQDSCVSTKSFSVVFCRVQSNFSDWTIQIDRGASGQLSK